MPEAMQLATVAKSLCINMSLSNRGTCTANGWLTEQYNQTITHTRKCYNLRDLPSGVVCCRCLPENWTEISEQITKLKWQLPVMHSDT